MAEGFIAQILLPGFLGILMIGVGTSLSKRDFIEIFKQPKPILLGLLGQVVFLPMIALGLCYYFQLPGELAVGLVLVACSPGGASSNIMSFLAKADSSLSVSITSLSNLIAIVSMPLVFNIGTTLLPGAGSGQFFDVSLPFWETFLRLVLVILLPIAIGLYLKTIYPDFCQRFESKLRSLSGIFLLVITLGFIIKEKDQLLQAVVDVGAPVFLLNALSILAGVLLGIMGRLPINQIKTLGIEIGFQNGALAMTVAIGILANSTIAIPAVVYGGPMFVNGILFVVVVELMSRHRIRKQNKQMVLSTVDKKAIS